jgi:hypothetical protein
MGWKRNGQNRDVARFLTPFFLPTPTPPTLRRPLFDPAYLITVMVSMPCILPPLTKQ